MTTKRLFPLLLLASVLALAACAEVDPDEAAKKAICAEYKETVLRRLRSPSTAVLPKCGVGEGRIHITQRTEWDNEYTRIVALGLPKGTTDAMIKDIDSALFQQHIDRWEVMATSTRRTPTGSMVRTDFWAHVEPDTEPYGHEYDFDFWYVKVRGE